MDASNSSTSMLAGGMDAAACSNIVKAARWMARNSLAGAALSGAAKAGTGGGMTATTIAIATTTGIGITIAIGRLPLIRKGPFEWEGLFSRSFCYACLSAEE